MNDELVAKWLAVAVLSFGSLAVGLLPPVLVARCRGVRADSSFWRSCLSCILCTGAGLLLGTALVHMTREARAKLSSFESSFPGTTEVLLGFGFLAIYFTEEMVHLALHGTSRDYGTTRGDASPPPMGDGPPCYSSLSACEPRLNEYRPRETDHLLRSVARGEGVEATEENQSVLRRPLTSPTAPVGIGGGNDHEHQHWTSSPFPSAMLLLALSLHSSVEGLSIGVETTAKGVLFMLVMVAVHKFAIAFCLGAETVLFGDGGEWRQGSGPVGKSAAFLGIFALASAAGILVGALVDHSGMAAETSETVGAFLQAIASGAIIYVSLIEIIPRERSRCHSIGFCQFVGVALGFVAPVGFNFIEY